MKNKILLILWFINLCILAQNSVFIDIGERLETHVNTITNFSGNAYIYDSSSSIICKWDFNGDKIIDVTQNNINANYTYTSVGNYIATLYIITANGNSTHRRIEVIVKSGTGQQKSLKYENIDSLISSSSLLKSTNINQPYVVIINAGDEGDDEKSQRINGNFNLTCNKIELFCKTKLGINSIKYIDKIIASKDNKTLRQYVIDHFIKCPTPRYLFIIGHGGGYDTKSCMLYTKPTVTCAETDIKEYNFKWVGEYPDGTKYSFSQYDVNGDGDFDDNVSFNECVDLDGQPLYDYELSTLLNQNRESTFYPSTPIQFIFLNFCFSGGFLKNLSSSNRLIMSTASENEFGLIRTEFQVIQNNPLKLQINNAYNFITALIDNYRPDLCVSDWFYNSSEYYKSPSNPHYNFSCTPQFEDNQDGYNENIILNNSIDKFWGKTCLGKKMNGAGKTVTYTSLTINKPSPLINTNKLYRSSGYIMTNQDIKNSSSIFYKAARSINLRTGFHATANLATPSIINMNAKLLDYSCYQKYQLGPQITDCIESSNLITVCGYEYDLNGISLLSTGTWRVTTNNAKDVWFQGDINNKSIKVIVFKPGYYEFLWETSKMHQIGGVKNVTGYLIKVEFKSCNSSDPGSPTNPIIVEEPLICGFRRDKSVLAGNIPPQIEGTAPGNWTAGPNYLVVNASGSYLFKYTYPITNCPDYNEINIKHKFTFKCDCPGFNIPINTDVKFIESCNLQVDLNSRLPLSNGSWSLFKSDPIDATITSWGPNGQNSPTTIANVSKDGIYTFRWSYNNAQCGNLYYDQIIKVTDLSINRSITNISQTYEPSSELYVYERAYPNGSWSLVSGPGNAIIDNISPTIYYDYNGGYATGRKVTVNKAGTYKFKWSGLNICNNTNYYQEITFKCKDAKVLTSNSNKYSFTSEESEYYNTNFMVIDKPTNEDIVSSGYNMGTFDIMVDIPGNYKINFIDDNLCNLPYTHDITFIFDDFKSIFDGQVCGLSHTLNSNSNNSGLWQVLYKPDGSTVNLLNNSSSKCNVSVSQSGTYAFRWTETTNLGRKIKDYNVEFTGTSNQTVGIINIDDLCLKTFDLVAYSNENGGIWTSNKSVIFDDPNSSYTKVTVPNISNYEFKWTESNNCLSNDEFIINATLKDKVLLNDGTEMPIVGIGKQCWFAKDLNMGTQLNLNTNHQLQQNNNVIEKYCYNDDPYNCTLAGALYNWHETMNWDYTTNMGICPTGWHIPDIDEWVELENNPVGWKTNFNLNAKGWGWYYNYWNYNIYTMYWSSNSITNLIAKSIELYLSNYTNINYQNREKQNYLYSIRCIKDNPFKSAINNTDEEKNNLFKDSQEIIYSQIYPNPAKDYFILTLKDNIGLIKVELFSATGSKVHTETLYNEGGIVNLPDLIKGLYIVKIISLTDTFSEMLLIE